MMKKALIILIGLFALLIITILSIPRLIDWNSYRPDISQAVKEATGREMRIDGDLSVSIFPDLEIGAQQVRLANISGSPHPDMFSVESMRVKIGLRPLLSRKLVIDSLVIRKPKFFVEIDREGHSNWDFGTNDTPSPTAPPDQTPEKETAPPDQARGEDGTPPISELTLGDVRIEKGKYHYSDGATGQKLEAAGIELTASLPGVRSPFTLSARMVLNGEPVAADASLDSLHSMFTGGRVKVETLLDSKPIKMNFSTTVLGQTMAMLDGSFRLDVPSVRGFYTWLDQPVEASRLDPGPLEVRVRFASEGKRMEIEEAVIRSEGVNATATGSLDGATPIPTFDVKAEITRADLNAYLPRPGSGRREGEERSAATPSDGTQPPGPSDEPLDFTQLSKANGRAQVRISSVSYGDMVIPAGLISLTLADGTLKTSIDKLAISGGELNAAATLSPSENGATLDYVISIEGARAGPLLDALTRNNRLAGTMFFHSEGVTQGRSRSEMARSLNGGGKIKFLNGAIRGMNLGATLHGAKPPGFDGSSSQAQETEFSELGGSFTIRNGILSNHDLRMLAPAVRLDGGGLVVLPARTLDYSITATLSPTSGGRGRGDALAGLPIPIRVTGPWAGPQYRIDWESVLREAAMDPERLKQSLQPQPWTESASSPSSQE
jgi:AsmA protein